MTRYEYYANLIQKDRVLIQTSDMKGKDGVAKAPRRAKVIEVREEVGGAKSVRYAYLDENGEGNPRTMSLSTAAHNYCVEGEPIWKKPEPKPKMEPKLFPETAAEPATAESKRIVELEIAVDDLRRKFASYGSRLSALEGLLSTSK